MKFIHVTDTHLVPPGELLHGLDPLARLRACIADINANQADAELCVITGDLADKGEPAAYAALRDCLDGLVLPWRLLLGNHDDRARFRAAFPEVPCDAHGFVQSALDTPAGRLLFLDTVEPGTSAGAYCAARRDWLAGQLADAPGPVYLFQHHPPFDIGLPSLDCIRLRDEAPFAALLDGHDVRHMFFGHVQRSVAGSWRGIPFTTLRGTNHQVAFDFTADVDVPYTHDPPCYAVVFLTDDSTVVHHYDFMTETRWVPPANPSQTTHVHFCAPSD